MIETATAVIALFWTIYQQYQINKMCEKCPFLPKNFKEDKNPIAN